MITRTVQQHPAITRERVDKALSPIYLAQASTNLFNIRYPQKETIADITCLSFPHAVDPADGHTLPRPSFEKDVKPRLSEFSPVAVGHVFRQTWSSHWLRLRFRIPEAWKGRIAAGEAEPHLIFDAGCEAAVFTPDGQILQGLTGGDADKFRGNRRAEFLLTPDLFGGPDGKTVEVMIEVACNGLFGLGNAGFINPPDPDGSFTLATCELALLDLKADKLFWHFVALRDLSEAAPKGSLTAERATLVANAILNIVDRRDPSTFDAAIALAEEHVLGSPSAATTATTAATATGKEHPLASKVFAVGHCHIDNVWLWAEEETKRKVARSWSSQLRYFKHHDPSFTFVASQTCQFQFLKENHPRVFERLKEAIREGRFIPVGASVVEPDTNMPSGESLIRQILFGSQFLRDNFLPEIQAGNKLRHPRESSSKARIPHGDGTWWLPDSFGYSPQIPQILRQCGLRYFLTQKLSWSLINKPEHSSFFWRGLDNSVVLTHFPPADDYNAGATIADVLKTANNNKDIGRVSSSLMVYGNGDGGGGPNLPMFKQMDRMKGVPSLPAVIHCSPRQFYDDLAAEAGRSPWGLTEWKGELYLELHQGTLTSQAATKNFNRRCEVALHDAEFLQALLLALHQGGKGAADSSAADVDDAAPTSTTTTALIKQCWLEVLRHQFHDALPGSSIAQVYVDSTRSYQRVLEDLAGLKVRQLKALTERLAAAEAEAPAGKVVINTSAAARSEFVELPTADDDGAIFLRRVALPPYSCCHVKPTDRHASDGLIQRVDKPTPALLSAERLPPGFDLGPSIEVAADFPALSARPNPSRLVVKWTPGRKCLLVENGIFRVAIRPSDGTIGSLVDFRPPTPQEVVGLRPATLPAGSFSEDEKAVWSAANAFVAYADTPFFWDAWDTFPYAVENGTVQGLRNPPSSPPEPSIEILEAGPLRARIRLTIKNIGLYKGGLPSADAPSSPSSEEDLPAPAPWIQQDIVIAFNDPIIRFETAVDWRSASHLMLKVEFPLHPSIFTGTREGTYECAFGCAQRPLHASSSRDMAQHEVAGHRWSDLSNSAYGVALLNDSKYGNSAMRNGVLGLTLLRSPKAPDDHCDNHLHRFNYALMPHLGDARATKSALATLASSSTAQLARKDEPVEWQLDPSVCHAGIAFNSPLQLVDSPALSRGVAAADAAASFFTVRDATGRVSRHVVLDTVKLPERGRPGSKTALIVRLYEAYGAAGTAEVALGDGMTIKRVRGVNLLEELPGKEGLPAEGDDDQDEDDDGGHGSHGDGVGEEEESKAGAGTGKGGTVMRLQADSLLESAPADVRRAFKKVEGDPRSSHSSLVAVRSNGFFVSFHPFQIATFRVDLA